MNLELSRMALRTSSSEFQSLLGIWWIWNGLGFYRGGLVPVSIPNRDLMNLERSHLSSIPYRIPFQSLLGIWRIWNFICQVLFVPLFKFQSLLGIWWIWNRSCLPKLHAAYPFQSLLGIWWIWNILIRGAIAIHTQVSIPIRDLMNLERSDQ